MTIGVPRAAATYPGPVSLLTTNLAEAIRAISSATDVWPAKFATGTLAESSMLRTCWASDSVPVATMERLCLWASMSARAAKRSTGQHLSG